MYSQMCRRSTQTSQRPHSQTRHQSCPTFPILLCRAYPTRPVSKHLPEPLARRCQSLSQHHPKFSCSDPRSLPSRPLAGNASPLPNQCRYFRPLLPLLFLPICPSSSSFRITQPFDFLLGLRLCSIETPA